MRVAKCNCAKYASIVNPLIEWKSPAKQSNNIFLYAAGPGDALIMKYGKVWHIAVIKKVLPDGSFLVDEANFKRGVVADRVIKATDSAIRWAHHPS